MRKPRFTDDELHSIQIALESFTESFWSNVAPAEAKPESCDALSENWLAARSALSKVSAYNGSGATEEVAQ